MFNYPGHKDEHRSTEVLTYSRSKGAFAGLTLEGAVVEQDNDSTRAIYGKHMTFRNILSGKVSTREVWKHL
jgi:SH3 domain-containing YSC84-like protein 1